MSKLNAEELSLVKLAREYSDESKARALLEQILWPDGSVCPHCKNHKEKPVYPLLPKSGSKRPGRPGLYKCGACRKQFTIRVGTILEDSHLPIAVWLQAVFLICSSKKGVSAHQLHRMLDISYKAAWFMAHRIRFAMSPDKDDPKLNGTVEVDETFVGGKGDMKTKNIRKTPVVALVERGGRARVKVIASVTQRNLGQALEDCVSKEAVVNTDEHPGYKNPLKHWKEHHAVNHSQEEYRRKLPDGTVASTNTAESFFSLLKRGVIGAWHHVSKQHLPKYADEFAFRWNTRGQTDGERMQKFVSLILGKRLTYRQPA